MHTSKVHPFSDLTTMMSYVHTWSAPQVSVSMTHLWPLVTLQTTAGSWHTLGSDVNVPYRSMLSVILTLINALNISHCDNTNKCPRLTLTPHINVYTICTRFYVMVVRTNRRVKDATVSTKGNSLFKGKLLCPKPGFINIVHVSGSSVCGRLWEHVGKQWSSSELPRL